MQLLQHRTVWDFAADNDLAALRKYVSEDNRTDEHDGDGVKALHICASRGHVELVALLLKKGANPLLKDHESGWTPLHRALYHNHLEVALLLLRHNAPLTAGHSKHIRQHAHSAEPVMRDMRDDNSGSVGDYHGDMYRELDSEYTPPAATVASAGGSSAVGSRGHAHRMLRDHEGSSPLDVLTTKLRGALEVPTHSSSAGSRRAAPGVGESRKPAVRRGGHVYTLGKCNSQLGYMTGQRAEQRHPRLVDDIESGDRVVEIAAAKYHSLAVTSKGKVYAWGVGRDGRLGLGNEQTYLAPTPILAGGLGKRRVIKVKKVLSPSFMTPPSNAT